MKHMQYRVLGRTGVRVSEIGFGGAGAGLRNYLRRWDPRDEDLAATVEAALRRAVELGINYFDTAPKYGSEEVFGRGLKAHRKDIFLATKAMVTNADALRQSVEESLARLQTDYIDLIQFHGDWITAEQLNDLLKPDGILAGMKVVQKEGLVRFVGFTTEGTNGAASELIATGEFDVMQVQYNLMFQHPYDSSKRSGLMYEAEAQGMGVVIMRPLSGGMFTRWLDWVSPAAAKQAEWNRLLLSFVLSNPLTDVALVGMRSPQRVESNCRISGDASERIDLDALAGRFLRKPPGSDKEVWMPTSGRSSDDTSTDY